jgi:hypothetical protein
MAKAIQARIGKSVTGGATAPLHQKEDTVDLLDDRLIQ